MVVCSVLGCKNRSKSAAGNVSFHRFPKDGPELKNWILACGRDNWTPTPSASMCSAHFEDQFFVKTTNKKWLKPDSIPTMSIHRPETSERNVQSEEIVKVLKTKRSGQSLDVSQGTSNPQPQKSEQLVHSPKTKRSRTKLHSKTEVKQQIPSTPTSKSPVPQCEKADLTPKEAHLGTSKSQPVQKSEQLLHSPKAKRSRIKLHSKTEVKQQIPSTSTSKSPIPQCEKADVPPKEAYLDSARQPTRQLVIIEKNTETPREKRLRIQLKRKSELAEKRLKKLRAARQAQRRLMKKNAELLSIIT